MAKTGIHCVKCDKEMDEAETTDDLDGNLRTYYKCQCGNAIYVVVATTEEDEEEGDIHEAQGET